MHLEGDHSVNPPPRQLWLSWGDGTPASTCLAFSVKHISEGHQKASMFEIHLPVLWLLTTPCHPPKASLLFLFFFSDYIKSIWLLHLKAEMTTHFCSVPSRAIVKVSKQFFSFILRALMGGNCKESYHPLRTDIYTTVSLSFNPRLPWISFLQHYQYFP